MEIQNRADAHADHGSSLRARGSGSRYTGVAIALHWTLAATIFGLFAVGVYIANIPKSAVRLELIDWHQIGGVVFLILTAARILWRLTHQPPALPASVSAAMPAWQHRAHSVVHKALYVMFLVVPLLGWLYSSAAGTPPVLFGVLALPHLVPTNPALAEQLIHFHGPSGLVLMILAIVHIAAALKHQFVDRDGLLGRMLPGRK